MIRTALASLLLLSTLAPRPTAVEVPFDDPRWRVEADEAELVELDGRRALRLRDGRAWLPDVRLTDGTIEFDIAFGPERGFSGAVFRMRGSDDYEHFYFRPHQSGNPDASQYTPVINGVSGWQLYHGPEFAAPFRYRRREWMHVEIAFSGSRARVSLDGETLPVPRLKRAAASGAIGVHSDLAPAWFSDFRYSEALPDDWSVPDAAAEPVAAEIEGLVRHWRVSEAFRPERRPRVTLTDAFRNRLTWTSMEVEPEGLVNLARAEGVDDESRSVLAEFTLEATEAGHRLVRFGYSDLVRVFVNGRELYRGDNGYRSRDYRYLGTIGLFDAVVVPVVEGTNVLSFVVSENFGGWGVMAAVDPA